MKSDWQLLGFRSREEQAKAIQANIKAHERKKKLERTSRGLLILGYEEEAYQKWLEENFLEAEEREE